MTLTYVIQDALYINLTNRCPCACTFCLRHHGPTLPKVEGQPSLWLEQEPTEEEMIADFARREMSHFREFVFCGYGEPTMRLDLLLCLAGYLKKHFPSIPIRVNTNGLADLIWNAHTAPRFKGLVDTLSISLNTSDPAEYLAVCRPKFGEKAYPALLAFAQEAKTFVPHVVMTVVGDPVTTSENRARCQKICNELGVTLRVRAYETPPTAAHAKADSAVDLCAEIQRLKTERHAVILAHNYQPDEVQACADFTGDSLELARKATQIDSDVIVFCGVYFMAETAAILNPTKTVLIPDTTAGCPMADMVTAEDVRRLKAEHPGALAVCYVNSTAEVKAECDVCVTSGNAERVMATVAKGRDVLFVPDQHLGGYVSGKLGQKYVLWPGYCPTHARLTVKRLATAREAHPNALVLVHPECARDVRDAADACLSTGGMCQFVRESASTEFIIGTEVGLLYRLQKENPTKKFYPVDEGMICPNMKKTSLEKIRACLETLSPRVEVPASIASQARGAIETMLKI